MQSTSYPQVLAFGEVLWDLLPSGKVLGGAPCNVVYRLHELGVSSALVSRIGNDLLGKELQTELLKRGVNLSFIQTDSELSTGTVDVTLTADGNPHFEIREKVAFDKIALTDELLRASESAKVICYGTLVQRSEVSRATLMALLSRAPSAIKVLDINLRKGCYSPETLIGSLSYAHILKLNRSEVTSISEIFSPQHSAIEGVTSALFQKFSQLKQILITLGEEGVEAHTRGGELIQVRSRKVTVRDTIGAGDAFTAGFIAASLQEKSLYECCLLGNALGALAATKTGGMSAILPSELREFL